jgi:hypothetical protein
MGAWKSEVCQIKIEGSGSADALYTALKNAPELSSEATRRRTLSPRISIDPAKVDPWPRQFLRPQKDDNHKSALFFPPKYLRATSRNQPANRDA